MANNDYNVDNSVSTCDYSEAEDNSQDPITQAFNAWQNSSIDFPEMSSNPSMFQSYTPVSTPTSLGSPALNISPSGYDSFSYNNFAAYVPNQDCGLIFTPQPRMLLPDVYQQSPQIDFSQHIENQSQTVIGVQANSCSQPIVKFDQLKNPPPYSHQSTNISLAESTQGEHSQYCYDNSAHSGNGNQTVPNAYFLPSPPVSRLQLHENSVEAEHPDSTQKNHPRKRVTCKKITDPKQIKKLQRGAVSSDEFRKNEKKRNAGRAQVAKNLQEMMCAERLMPVNPLMLAFFNSFRLNVNLLKSIDATDNGSRTKIKIETMNHMLMECENSLNVLKNIISQM